AGGGPDLVTKVLTRDNRIAGMQRLVTGEVEIELASADPFVVSDALPRLRIGDHETRRSRYEDDGDLHRIIFTMSAVALAASPNGAPMSVVYGAGVPTRQWDFGPFAKDSIK